MGNAKTRGVSEAVVDRLGRMLAAKRAWRGAFTGLLLSIRVLEVGGKVRSRAGECEHELCKWAGCLTSESWVPNEACLA